MNINIELIGKTVFGKNKVREWGKFAKVIQETDKVLFDAEKCIWIFVHPHNRWIKAENDKDFIVKEIP